MKNKQDISTLLIRLDGNKVSEADAKIIQKQLKEYVSVTEINLNLSNCSLTEKELLFISKGLKEVF